MTSGQKVAFSFLLSILFFAAFVVMGQAGLLSQVETRFYKQAKVREKQQELEKLVQGSSSYISNILTRIQTGENAYLKSAAVRSYVNQNPSEKDEADRRALTVSLLEELPGLDGMRLIEKNARNLHFSTYESDILRESGLTRQYKNYPDIEKAAGELKSEQILVNPEAPSVRILLDSERSRFVVSFPFYIVDNFCFGSLVCYFGFRDFENYLIGEGAAEFNESFSAVTDKGTLTGGFVAGIPAGAEEEFSTAIRDLWNGGAEGRSLPEKQPQPLMSGSSGTWVIMSSAISQFWVGRVYPGSDFEISREIVYLIYTAVFLSLLLIFFLIFSLRQDAVTVIRSRIKRIQLGIINEFFENKDKISWDYIVKELELRSPELSDDIKKQIAGKSRRKGKLVEQYLDASWSEIFGILKEQHGASSLFTGASIEDIRRVMEDVLQTARLNVNIPAAIPAAPVGSEMSDRSFVSEPEDAEPLEDAEELADAEPLEDAGDFVDAEELGEAEDLEEEADFEEAEELAEPDDLGELTDAEELPDAEPLEDAEELTADSVEVSEPEDVTELTATASKPADAPDTASAVSEPAVDELLDEIIEPDENELLGGLLTPKSTDNPLVLERLEEVDEPEELEPEGIPQDEIPIYAFNALRLPDEESTETFMQEITDGFPTVENVFAEALCIGTQYTKEAEATPPLNFSAVKYRASLKSVPISAVEAELIPVDESFFSMTSFGASSSPSGELEPGADSTIVENDGVFSISQNLSYSNVRQNPEFKALVDSVLR